METIFFGSSTEFRDSAIRLGDKVRAATGNPILGWWDSEAFQLGQTTIEAIELIPSKCRSAILFLTCDDKTIARGKLRMAPRDNIIFEAGYLMASLGRSNVALVVVGKTKIPSDLLGVTVLQNVDRVDPVNLGQIANSIAAWVLGKSNSEAKTARSLASIAEEASQRYYREFLYDSVFGPNYVQFPLAVYPHFLKILLTETQFNINATEVIGEQHQISFSSRVEQHAGFDHRACHWYLYADFPPNQILDQQKVDLLHKTSANPRFRRIMFVPALEKLPPMLRKVLLDYFSHFCHAQKLSKLTVVLTHQASAEANQMVLASESGSSFRAERLIGTGERSLVAFRPSPAAHAFHTSSEGIEPEAFVDLLSSCTEPS